jgi:hypothetical protein
MQYFTYSPLDMDATEAYQQALKYLRYGYIVHVRPGKVTSERATPGEPPRAQPNTYLVRVEEDGSLRHVHSCFDD